MATSIMKTKFLSSAFALGLALSSQISYGYVDDRHDYRFPLCMEDKFEKDPGDSLVATGAKPELVSSQFSFTEGPAVDKKGNIFFTDQPNDKIWKWSAADGKLSLFMDKTGRSNGLYFDAKGNILSCADEKNELWSISPKKKVTVLLKDLNGKRLNGPNDLWPDKKGNIYFTDPFYPRPYWDRKTSEMNGQKVYLLRKGQAQPVALTDDLKSPNGIVGTPDGKYLYVADIGDKKTYRYSINSDGTLSDKTLFIEQGSDGITMDEKGNLYITGNGVTIYNKEGQKLLNIPVPAIWTANLCFGGKNRDILFITASESVFTLKMQVKGVE